MREVIFRSIAMTSILAGAVVIDFACDAADVDRELVERVIERQKPYGQWKTRYVDAVYVQRTSAWTKYERGRLSETSNGMKRYRVEAGDGDWSVDKTPDRIEEWVHDGNATVMLSREHRSIEAEQGVKPRSSAVEVYDASRRCPSRDPFHYVSIGVHLSDALRAGDMEEARLTEQGVAELRWKQRVPNSYLVCTARVDMNAPAIPQTLSVETRNRKGDMLFSTTATFEKEGDITALKSVKDIAYRMPIGNFGPLLKSPEKIETTRMETMITVLEARLDAEQELEPKIFSIEIPVGWKVHDNRTGAEFTVRDRPLLGIDLKR